MGERSVRGEESLGTSLRARAGSFLRCAASFPSSDLDSPYAVSGVALEVFLLFHSLWEAAWILGSVFLVRARRAVCGFSILLGFAHRVSFAEKKKEGGGRSRDLLVFLDT